MKTIFSHDKRERIVFHYNKAHNQNTNIPPWVIKHKGESYYIHHLDSQVGFSTKETPGNDHTKGSLLDAVPRHLQYEFVKSFKQTPFAKAYLEED